MNRRLLLFSPILAFALVGFNAKPATASVIVFSVDEDAAYAAGTKALNENRWADAVTSFDQVINAKGKKVDAALYWKAYALNKLGKADLASDTCNQLRTQFRTSTWNDDCRAITISIHVDRSQADAAARAMARADRDRDRDGRHTSDPDADIKILALNGVMRQNPAQAIPLVRGILSSDQPASVKQHAFFVVAQSKSPEAEALMRDVILGKMGPELQVQAIQSSGIYRGRPANDSLAEAYRATSDVKVKHAVISAFFVSGDDTHLVELARQEKDLELKKSMVSQLSLMHGKAASDYMLELLK